MTTLRPNPVWTWLLTTTERLRAHPQILLLSCLVGAGANSLIFVFVHQPDYNHDANWLGVLAFWGLAAVVPFQRHIKLISHLALLTALTLMTYVTLNTGGINSPAMVWMTILAVPALLLLDRRAALLWLGLILCVCGLEYVAVLQGWVSGAVLKEAAIIPWVLTDKINVAISLMLAVNFYDRLHNQQMTALAQSNEALENTQAALLQAQSHKDEFIASVGHELRTPMNAILGLNGVLLSELADEPDNAQIAKHIGESTQQLLGLVNDILDFSQLEAARLALSEKPLLLDEGLRHMLKTHEALAAAKQLQLLVHVDEGLPTAVLLDPLRLQQVLDNLLDNAVKFTDHGHITLRVADAHGFIRFEIEDSGRGIPLDRQEDVFKRFEHADVQTKRAFGGTGLGLAICERLVSLQGGRIGVQSRPHQGALFWFELPLKPVQLNLLAAHSTSVALDNSAAVRFLLVDDNAVNQLVASLVLKKMWPQADITTASSGEQALQLLDTQHVDLVLMDMVMPGMDGLETTRLIRQQTRVDVANLPIIGLTANTTPKDRDHCLEAGMNDVLSKPMDGATVQTTLQYWLGQALASAAQRDAP
jgi:signal transduction histidine kinase/CheY-like chemotaxis protein